MSEDHKTGNPEHGLDAEHKVAARIFDILPDNMFETGDDVYATAPEDEPKEADPPAEPEVVEDPPTEPEEADEADEEEEGEDDTEGEDDESDETAEADEDLTYTVKVDGEEVEMTLDELKAGFSRTESWTRKSQALANERKKFEGELADVTEKRAEYASKLSTLEQHLTAKAPVEPEGDDPREWVRYQKAQSELAAVQAEQTRVYEEHLTAQSAHLEQVVADETELLRGKVPEWKDDAKMAAGLKSLFTYATEGLGFDEEDVRNTTNHKLLFLLWKAKAYDELDGAKAKVAKKTKKAKTLKPGTRQSAKSQARGKKKSTARKGREALRESGTMKDAASMFEEAGFLDDM